MINILDTVTDTLPLFRGGYTLGSASDTANGALGFKGIYDGNDLILQAGGKVVVVIIQYRLGIFGFLPGTKVKGHGALNAGLRKLYLRRFEVFTDYLKVDQQYALKWIQQHVCPLEFTAELP